VCRWAVAVAFTALWWWAAARLLLVPGAGALEGAVAAGGWGLSVLPVHCLPKARADGALASGRWRRAWSAGRSHGRPRGGPVGQGPAGGSSG